MKIRVLLSVMLVILSSACGTPEPGTTPSATASPSIIPTGSPTASITPSQPTSSSTPRFIDATLTIKVNVRSGPGTEYDALGQLEAGTGIQIIARDSKGAWYLIRYDPAPQGRAWVAAAYVTVATGIDVPLESTPTPSGPVGRVIQRLNIRSGPGTTYDTLGMLEPGVVVSLTGKNLTASWFQITFPSGPGGHGWVTSQYIQTDSTTELAVLDNFGMVVTPGGAGTPSGPVIQPTSTVGPAFADGDSSAHPAIQVTFSGSGTRQFTYSSQVSTPEGDGEDWVEFKPYSPSGTKARLYFSLACTGNGLLTVELWQVGGLYSGWDRLECGESGKAIQLPAGQVFLMRLAPVPGDGLQMVAYTLKVENNP
jgi:uncharacterized protein YraI